jgi:DtxR family Mn-dependent transcriptional regulator
MNAEPFFSENAQMYLVDILRLAKEGQPVPLSQLAATLTVSPISANQMCRRLQDEGLVTYVPYKGVSITSKGEQLAARILRRHRVWEVFLVERLQMRWTEAHETACRLEHATPDEVIERLDLFLGHPRVNPQGDPIPDSAGILSDVPALSLEEVRVGERGHCIRCTADEASCAYLWDQGFRPGASLQVLAVAPESLLIEVNGKRVALERSLAAALWVERDKQHKGEVQQ